MDTRFKDSLSYFMNENKTTKPLYNCISNCTSNCYVSLQSTFKISSKSKMYIYIPDTDLNLRKVN